MKNVCQGIVAMKDYIAQSFFFLSSQTDRWLYSNKLLLSWQKESTVSVSSKVLLYKLSCLYTVLKQSKSNIKAPKQHRFKNSQ